MTILAPEPTTTAREPGDELTHTACECTPDIALCGVDVSHLPWGDGSEETTCVVCRDLEDLDCPRCDQ